MKKVLFATIFLLVSVAHAADFKVPTLFFGHSFLYDSTVCPSAVIKDEVYRELDDRTTEFSKKWDENGEVLFNVLFQATDKGFRRNELTATLSLCPMTSSYSSPLVLNIRPYLKTVMAPKPVWSDEDFVDLVFHELLHTWVVDNLGWSDLNDKYKNETSKTRNHLHVIAAQVYVYSQLGREDFLRYLKESYRPFPDYARAWDIVGQEGHIEFLKELGFQY